MATFVGTIRKLGVEGGVWALIGDDGQQYHLVDAPAAIKKDGKRVTIEGEVPRGASIAMIGSMLRVRSFRDL
jgi:hypothetical protein